MEDDTLSPDARAEDPDPDPDDDFIHDFDQGRDRCIIKIYFIIDQQIVRPFCALQ